MAATRLVLVEDDDEPRQVLAEQLLASSLFHPIGAATLGKASQQLGSSDARFDAIVLGVRSGNAVFAIGPYAFRSSTKLLTGPGKKRVRLTAKEAEILCRNAHRSVPRQALVGEVCSYHDGVTTHTLEIQPAPYVFGHSTAMVTAPSYRWAA